MSDVDSTLLTSWPTLLLVLVTYPLLRALYNSHLHPLAKTPGPRSWACSRLPFVWSLLRGTIVHDVERLHRRHGPILRIAPDEVTFASDEAWHDIFMPRPHHQPFLKDPTWWRTQPRQPMSLISAIAPDQHARIRRALAPGFTLRALKAQEPILHLYANLFIDRLRDIVSEKPGREMTLDIGPWFNFFTFDIFGDLGFGESFDCLQNSQYHPWIRLLFSSVKAASFIAAAKFYPWLAWVLIKCIPPSLKKMSADHFNQIADKVDRRLNYELSRPDIMSRVIGANGENKMSRGETNATFMVLTTAGSETTATVLTGTLNYLVNNPDKLAILTAEMRVSIQAYSINRDPKYFHSPTEFQPERWLPEASTDPTSPFRGDRRQALQAFSMGPRSCMGQHLAWAEMMLVLARLLWTFDVHAVDGRRVRWEDLRTFLLVEKKPVEIRMCLKRAVSLP
ncbi:cytochrome P450 [Apiospora kogelbergensis]|uniref:Cytochrome P450 n=1 Tax=Apiospora kogelbergensis TaxID=1337665 RepID=A0AAW0REL3_9PEZI